MKRKGPKPGCGPLYIVTEEIRSKMRESSRKRWQDQSQRDKVAQQRTVRLPITEIVELYLSGLSTRQIAQRFGVRHDTIHRRLRDAGIVLRQKGTCGHKWDDEHYRWKGDDAGYAAFHTRLNRRKGKPKRCEICGSTDPKRIYDWANLTGKYADINDYKRMCRDCHRKFYSKRNKNDKRDNAAA